MCSTPNHRAVKRVLMQNILLQNIFCINEIALGGAHFQLAACIECAEYL